MDFGSKVDALADLYLEYNEDEAFADFFDTNDLGVPLAVALRAGGVSQLTEDGERWILDSFDDLCILLDIDPYGEYAGLQGMLQFSDEY